jgi:hypothetical protein
MSNLYEGMIRRMESRPTFWASALLKHRQLTGLTEFQQADRLFTTSHGLTTLSMCKMPRQEHREEDIQAVAKHSGAAASALTALLAELGL